MCCTLFRRVHNMFIFQVAQLFIKSIQMTYVYEGSIYEANILRSLMGGIFSLTVPRHKPLASQNTAYIKKRASHHHTDITTEE
jgi:hypothetical protein